jgi:cyclohexyl-isocyanide hydratase
VNIAVLIYHEVLELEVALALTAFRTAARYTDTEVSAYTVSKTRASVVGASGLVMTPSYAFSAAPDPDALVVPGGAITERIAKDPQTREYLRSQAERVPHLLTASSGALILGEAGLLGGQVVTGFPALLETLWKFDPGDVLEKDFARNPNGRNFAARSNGIGVLALEVIHARLGADVAANTAQHLGLE